MQEIVQSVDRTLTILEVLSDYEEGLGITEISEKVELHKSTVHRLLNTLIYKGYIKQDKNTNKYGLTLKLFELGNKKVESMDLVSVVEPYLKELMEKTNEVIHLAIREGSDIVYVSKMEPQKSMKMYTRIGMRKPIYCTAMGKAMMAYMNEEDIQKIWDESDVKKLTPNTMVDFSKLQEKLKDIRVKGYAMDDQEVEEGIRCVGTILKDYKNGICGAISISGSIISFTEDKTSYFSKIILEYADKISKELGYRK
jgi:IclR family KDG regulon transcriptional repressor